jgi:hypothetical protein
VYAPAALAGQRAATLAAASARCSFLIRCFLCCLTAWCWMPCLLAGLTDICQHAYIPTSHLARSARTPSMRIGVGATRHATLLPCTLCLVPYTEGKPPIAFKCGIAVDQT